MFTSRTVLRARQTTMQDRVRATSRNNSRNERHLKREKGKGEQGAVACDSDGFLAVVGRNVPGQSVHPAPGDGVSPFVSSTAPLRRTRDGPPQNHHHMDLSDHQICDLERFQEAKLIEPLGGGPGRLLCILGGRGGGANKWCMGCPSGRFSSGRLVQIYFHSLPTSTLLHHPNL